MPISQSNAEDIKKKGDALGEVLQKIGSSMYGSQGQSQSGAEQSQGEQAGEDKTGDAPKTEGAITLINFDVFVNSCFCPNVFNKLI